MKKDLQGSSIETYAQLIKEPTTRAHTMLDPIYVSPPPTAYSAGVSQTYYSFHDSVYYVIYN